MYLYRAVDSQGNTLELLLSPTRDAQAAKHFFAKAPAAPVLATSDIRSENRYAENEIPDLLGLLMNVRQA